MAGFEMPMQFGGHIGGMGVGMGGGTREEAIIVIHANKQANDEFKILQEKVSKLQGELKALTGDKKESDARNIKSQIEPLEKKMRELRSKFESLDITPCKDIDKFPPEMKTYTWIKTLRAVQMGLLTAENMPESVLTLNIERNMITNLGVGQLPKKCLRLDISRNRISVLENLPEGLLGIDAARAGIESIDEKCLPDCLETMNLTDNKLKKVGKMGHVKILDLSHNELLADVSELNNEMLELDCSHCAITKIEEGKFPSKIVKLTAYRNPLMSIRTLQASLRIVDISYCELKEFPILCNGLEQLDISHNMISEIPDPEKNQNAYPITLYKLDLSHNPCKTPKKLKEIIRSLISSDESGDPRGQMSMGMGMDPRFGRMAMDENMAERFMLMNSSSDSNNGESSSSGGPNYKNPNYIIPKKSIVL